MVNQVNQSNSGLLSFSTEQTHSDLEMTVDRIFYDSIESRRNQVRQSNEYINFSAEKTKQEVKTFGQKVDGLLAEGEIIPGEDGTMIVQIANAPVLTLSPITNPERNIEEACIEIAEELGLGEVIAKTTFKEINGDLYKVQEYLTPSSDLIPSNLEVNQEDYSNVMFLLLCLGNTDDTGNNLAFYGNADQRIKITSFAGCFTTTEIHPKIPLQNLPNAKERFNFITLDGDVLHEIFGSRVSEIFDKYDLEQYNSSFNIRRECIFFMAIHGRLIKEVAEDFQVIYFNDAEEENREEYSYHSTCYSQTYLLQDDDEEEIDPIIPEEIFVGLRSWMHRESLKERYEESESRWIAFRQKNGLSTDRDEILQEFDIFALYRQDVADYLCEKAGLEKTPVHHTGELYEVFLKAIEVYDFPIVKWMEFNHQDFDEDEQESLTLSLTNNY